jgi:nucleoside-diphosphate-sugar epimerase
MENPKTKYPVIILTGASGFLGKNLIDDLKNDYRIFAIARRSQQECHAPIHPHIAWIQADISNINSISRAFREIQTAGGADCLLHLAAFYEFAYEKDPHYRITNVDGTKNVLNLAQNMNLKLFLFASSVVACSFPEDGKTVNEDSPPDGEHIYAWSKRLGEEMILGSDNKIPSCIIRFGAVYSDWCEFPPLYMLLKTWLSHSWRAPILAGKGNSAIPYIHVRDVVCFFRKILTNPEEAVKARVLIASTKDSTQHSVLHHLATRYYRGEAGKPIFMPKFLTAIGLYLMNFFGQLFHHPPFERPWMRKYIDRQMNIDNSRTCHTLNWHPSTRLTIERRIPFLVERLKSEPYAWQLRNMAAMRKVASRPSFNFYMVLSDAEDEIIEKVFGTQAVQAFEHLKRIDHTDLIWFIKLVYRLILTSIHSNNKLLIQNYFEISGQSRFQAGYTGDEIIALLQALKFRIQDYIRQARTLKDFEDQFYDLISLPIEFAIDEVENQYEIFQERSDKESRKVMEVPVEPTPSARELLEETIWNMLVHRK